MIITLMGANFSTHNIGTLDTYYIQFIGTGVINENTSVDRESNTGYTTIIVLNEGYELNGTIKVEMGGIDITASAVNGLTITIPTKVTGNVLITVPTKGTTTGDEGGGTPTVTFINKFNLNDPDVLWDMSTTSGSTDGVIKAESGKGVSGYIPVTAGDIIRGGSYRTTTNTDGTNYYPFKSAAIYWYDSSKNFLKATTNPTFNATYYTNDFICTVPSTPANIAYFRVYLNETYKDTTIITINSIAPTTFIAYGDTTTPSGYIPQGTVVSGGDTGGGTGGTTSGTSTLEGVISAPSSTINVFNPEDANTTMTLDTVAANGESYKTQSMRGTSGFIACKSGDVLRGATYREETSSDTGNNCYPFKASPVYFYDGNLNYVTRQNNFIGSGMDYKMTVPSNSNIAYFRVMINTKYIETEIITVNNALPTEFIAYAKQQ